MKYWTWLDFRLFWWYVFSNGEVCLPDPQHFLGRIGALFADTSRSDSSRGVWVRCCLDASHGMSDDWEIEILWRWRSISISIHIHPYPSISIQSSSYIEVTCMAMYLCIYVSMYLCIYVSMYLSDFIKQAFQPCPVQPALVLRWTHPAVTQVLITKPASMPALAKLGKILGKRWGASLGAISQPCLAAGLRFQFHLWVDTCWHPYNALNHPWSSSSSSRASRCYCPIH